MNKSHALRLVRTRQKQKNRTAERVIALREELQKFRMLDFHCSDNAETRASIRNAIIVCVKQLHELGYSE